MSWQKVHAYPHSKIAFAELHPLCCAIWLAAFSSALCYCTAELLSWRGRPSSYWPFIGPVFWETLKRNNTTCHWKGIHHISITFFVYIQNSKFSIFFYIFFLSFSFTWAYGRKYFTNASSKTTLQATTDSPPRNMHTPSEDLYQICSKKCEILNFGFFTFLFFGFVNMGLHGSKSFTAKKNHVYSWRWRVLSKELKEL